MGQYVEMDECVLRRAHKAAALIRFDPDSGEDDEEDVNLFWIPYSQIEGGEDSLPNGTDVTLEELMLTEWIVEQKGIEEFVSG